MDPSISWGSMSVVATGLWRASLLTIAWGRPDYDATELESSLSNARRTFNGTGNNPAHPAWGSVGQRQLRRVAGASYTDRVSTPPGEDRPTPMEILSEVFVSTPRSSSTTNALFVGWGLLVGYDLFLNRDNASEPLDMACVDYSLADRRCSRASLSGPISFNRSQGELDVEGDGTRSPINYATAYIDLDWLYGRDEESATSLRTLHAGNLNLTSDELPHLLADGTWLVADQRPTRMPVTFALMTLLLREHNRCCNKMAPAWNAATDEDAYHVCRQWTIAVFQHISENEFSQHLVGGSPRHLESAAYNFFYDDTNDNNTVNVHRRTHRLSVIEIIARSRHLARTIGSYDVGTNAGVDVVFSTVAIPALYSALPAMVGLRDDNYNTIHGDGMELAAASADMAGLIRKIGGIESIVRGAAYSRAQTVDLSLMAKGPPSSFLFNLLIVAIQRGRDHGIPSYIDVRQACGYSRVRTFKDITSDYIIKKRLADAYGDVNLLDAFTGALAENEDGSGLFAGPLLRAVFLEQLYRAIVGDRHYHSHTWQNEDTKPSKLRDLILDNSLVSSVPLETFMATATVVSPTSSSIAFKETVLTDGFKIAWNVPDEPKTALMHMTISATGIGQQGMIAVGFGGQDMASTDDFVICVVSSESLANCTDHSGRDGHGEPPYDPKGPRELEVVNISRDGEWTSVTFARWGLGNDESDYPLTNDIAIGNNTPVVYAWRSGEGIGMHLETQRGSTQLNFANGTMTSICGGPSDYYALHGTLLLVAWLVVAPYGIYQARYRKGKTTLFGNPWWEVHRDSMVISAEALLPLAITAIVTTGGPHNSTHAKWGFYMIGAIAVQILTGWARVRALTGKSNNFSRFHRANKHFHIYAGWFAYIAGLVQCYRGLMLVADSERVVVSAVEMTFSLGRFEIVRTILLPIWTAIVPLAFIILEVRKQFTRYFKKGAANLCGMVELINEQFSDETLKKELEDRLMPRTEELPLHTTHEFNAKVLNGRSWVIVDGAVLDVGSFVKRHPGGTRVLMNVMGTDVTSEIIGEEASIGNSGMAFDPHTHSDIALEIARSLVVGYIEEEDDMEMDRSDEGGDDGGVSSGGGIGFFNRSFLRARRMSSLSDSDRERTDTRGSSLISHRGSRLARAPLGRETSSDPGHLVSWPGLTSSGDNVESRTSFGRGRRSSSYKPRGRRTGDGSGGSDSGGESIAVDERMNSFRSDGSTEGEHARQLIASDKIKKTTGGMVSAGAAMRLSAKAAAILNAKSPPATRAELPTRGQSETDLKQEKDAVPSVPADTAVTELSPAMTVSPKPDRPRKQLSARSFSLNRPVELNHPVVVHTTSSFNTKPVMTIKRPKPNPVQRILGRIGSQLNAIRGVSGDESDVRQEDRPFKAMRRVREKKNLLDFFHVCPLLLHEKMGDGGDRPVYKFVFACPGRAAKMVNAMKGVCHFRMRAAKQAGMTVVQRSYNAFAVRVQREEENKRRVLPASETDEGALCIEMRIRLYPDGLMSGLLMQLIKNSENPAVQLQGPFLQDRLIPPPAHRNVIMIAAGTGVNPMVQMIRDYLNPESRNQGTLRGAHSRLVLLWQNNKEGDLFCADELTTLQAKAKGLLEVTVIISGNKTRRNVPGYALRRAKSRLTRNGVKADLVNRGANRGAGTTEDANAGGGGAGDQASGTVTSPGARGRDEFPQNDVDKLGDELIRGVHSRRYRLAKRLSRVSEEGTMSLGSSFVNSTRTFGGRDLDSGGGGNSVRSPMALYEGADNETLARVGGDGGNKDVPWSPICGGRIKEVADDSGWNKITSTCRRQTRSTPPRDKEVAQRTGRLDSARAQSIAARIAGCSTNVWGEREDRDDSDRRDGIPIPLRRSGGEGRRARPFPMLNRQRATRNVCDASSDVSGCVSEGAGSHNDSNCEQASRGGSRLVSPFRRAGIGRGFSPKRFRKKERTGRANEAGDDGDGGKPTRPTFSRTKSPKIDIATNSSGDEIQSDNDTTVAGGGGRLSRSHRRGSSDDPFARSEMNTHAHSMARGRSPERSSSRSSRDSASEDLSGSSLEDSGSGLQHTKLSTAILKKAIGPEVMRAVASLKASGIDSAVQEGSADSRHGSSSALNNLIGTETSGGALQVVVSGPEGFVFYVEGLLGEINIPRQAVVLLD